MDTSKNGIKEILMRRDSLTSEDAQDIIDSTQEEIDEAIPNGDLEEIESIIRSNLGLDPDCIETFL